MVLQLFQVAQQSYGQFLVTGPEALRGRWRVVLARISLLRGRVTSYSKGAKRLIGFLFLVSAAWVAVRAEEFSGSRFLERWHLAHRPAWTAIQGIAQAKGFREISDVPALARIRRTLPSGWDESDWIWLERGQGVLAAGDRIFAEGGGVQGVQALRRFEAKSWDRIDRTWIGVEDLVRRIEAVRGARVVSPNPISTRTAAVDPREIIF